MRELTKKGSFRLGMNFAIISAVITTLGLMVGLNATTASRMIILGGIITIAIADSLADALGVHISQEARKETTKKEVWESTLGAFIGKFIISLLFIIPLLIFEVELAIILNIIIGIGIITYFSYYISSKKGENPVHSIAEHLIIAALVIIITQLTGSFISTFFI